MTTPTRPRTALASAALAAAVVVAGAVWKAVHLGSRPGQYLWWGYSDVPALFHAERLDVGAVPYLDHPVEYPVLTGLQMWVAGTPATDGRSFLWWTVPILAAGAAVAAFLLARELGGRRALVLAAAPTLLVSGAVNWDLPSVALATAGLVAHRRGRDGWAGVWLGLGTAAKLWPALALLAVVPAAWGVRGRRAGLATAGAALGAWTAVNLPVVLLAPSGWWRFVELNRERGLDWDPLLAVASRTFGWVLETSTVNRISTALVLVGLAVVVAATVRRTDPVHWHHAVLPLVAWFLLANKVWSPQFSLWLLPLFALTFPGWRWVLAFGAADVAVTITRFRYLGAHVGDAATESGAWSSTPFDVALVVRAVVLVGAVWVGWRHATDTPLSRSTPSSLSRSTPGSLSRSTPSSLSRSTPSSLSRSTPDPSA